MQQVEPTTRSSVLSFAAAIPWATYLGKSTGATEGLFVDAEDVRVIQRFSAEPSRLAAALENDEVRGRGG